MRSMVERGLEWRAAPATTPLRGAVPLPVPGRNGFTLVELLVSLLIFAMLSAAGVTLLRFSVGAQDVAEARLGRLAQLRRSGALLAGDLAQAAPRLSRDEAGAQRPAFAGASGEGEGAVLAFVRLGVENAGDQPRSSLRKIEYRLVDSSLQRRSWAFVDGAAPSTQSSLIDGVRRIRLRYRDEKGEWRDRWDPTRAVELPRAVELVMDVEGEGMIRQLFLTGADL
jgi:general secretion pathway protein J